MARNMSKNRYSQHQLYDDLKVISNTLTVYVFAVLSLAVVRRAISTIVSMVISLYFFTKLGKDDAYMILFNNHVLCAYVYM